MQINYGIIAVCKETMSDIWHFCGYEVKPNRIDFESLQKELNEDEEFGLVGKQDLYFLMEAPKDIVEKFRQFTGDNE